MINNKKCLTYTQINKILSNSLFSSLSFSFTSYSVEPMEMYQDIFSTRELEKQGKQEQGKYNLIARRIKHNDKYERVSVYSTIITQGLNELETIINENDNKREYVYLSCVSYAGKDNTNINARFMYALVIDLDNLQIDNKSNGLSLFINYYCYHKRIPIPNYIVSSGHGIHLYFCFQKPIPMYKRIRDKVFELKKQMVKRIWNEDISTIEEQHGSITQGFRVGGTFTKDFKHKAKCFKCNAPKYTLYDLAQTTLMQDNEKEKYKDIDKLNCSNNTLNECKKKYPEWYQKRIIEKQPKGKWNIKKDLYYWWLRQMKEKNKYHHRYYCCMCAVIFGVKCDIAKEQIKKDLYDLYDYFDNSDNAEPFTYQDIDDSLSAYFDDNYFWTRDKMSLLSAIEMIPNKRNYRKQKEHLEIARFTLQIDNKKNGKALQGRKPKNNEYDIYNYILQESDKEKDIAQKFNISVRQARRYKKKLREL